MVGKFVQAMKGNWNGIYLKVLYCKSCFVVAIWAFYLAVPMRSGIFCQVSGLVPFTVSALQVEES